MLMSNVTITEYERDFLMTTKGYKIGGCLLLSCAISLAVICASAANSQVPLSENEMDSVYGGCTHCDYSGNEGCAHGSRYTCSERLEVTGNCSGQYISSCRDDEMECQNDNQDFCHDQSVWCPSEYSKYDCVVYADTCDTVMNTEDLDCHRGYTSAYQYCTTE